MFFRQPTLRFKRALIASVLFAFVLAQALGLMHRIVHAPFVGYGLVHASAEAPRAEVAVAPPARIPEVRTPASAEG